TEEDDKSLTPEKLADKSKNEILAIFADLLDSKPAWELRKEVEAIKIAFYKAHKAESAAHRDAYLAEGGDPDAYKPVIDEGETRLKELIAVYRDRRDTYLKELDSSFEKNLKDKQQIIEELKELIAGSEIMGSTFNAFRELQKRWRESGPVPAAHSKDIWETYHLHVEKFYDYIKINKELRDLDLKKNYETKLALCEEAESLLVNESSVIEAFHHLQKLHEQWRECGPVGKEYKDVLWERFKEASTKINKAHQDHFDAIKEEQQRNLNLKNELCTKAEELAAMPRSTRSDWDKASDELIEIQKVWKTIGFAPKRDNTRIYERFRAACDTFFDKKREFFLTMKDEMENNMQAKIALCIAAEALAQSSDWKKSTDELIALQAEWKKIGAVSRKQSDAVWKRFRAACDTFFNRKSEHYAGLEGQYTDNLNAKKALIEEIRAYSPADSDSPLDRLKEFQRRWAEIGFVPVKEKDALYAEYRNLIDARFAEIRGGEKERRIEKFRARLKEGDDRHVRSERDKLHARLRQIESDITLLENNIGFFAKSKNAEAMVEDVRRKIAKSKEEMQLIIEKIKIIDTENKKQQEENDKK
ncbi:MAG: DUF349 domain-containing protein, partial [Rikenellaceae bacterium]|nr:DUF349 domain-containing protein [Rikenellaceae bacterium]